MVECDGQSQVAVMDLVNGINANEDRIVLSEAAINALDVRVSVNEADIINLTTRVVDLENDSVTVGDITDLTNRVTVNESNIALNASNISTNANDISTNQSDIAGVSSRVGTLESNDVAQDARLDVLETTDAALEPRITQNESDIAALQSATGVGFQGALLQHRVPTVGSVGGGSSSNTWTARTLNEVKYNSINGSTPGPTSITLPVGLYKIEALAMGEGSIHQAKIVSGTGIELLGTLMSGSGMSHVCGDLDLSGGADTISVATIVQTPVIDTGFGVVSPFTDDAIYVMLKIEKVG